MAVSVTLASTTLYSATTATQGVIQVASSSGMFPGTRLFDNGELFAVVSVGVSTSTYTEVNVRRGVDCTVAVPHNAGATLYIGRADQFYERDPIGLPPLAVAVQPWINALGNAIWFAQGDDVPGTNRYWQKQTTSYGTGPLGVRTTTSDPTAGT